MDMEGFTIFGLRGGVDGPVQLRTGAAICNMLWHNGLQ